MNINKKLQRAFGIGALVLTLGVGTAGCEGKVANHKIEPKRIEIKISEYTGITNSGLSMVYNGMNNEKTFSLSGSWATAVNTYYPSDSKEIQFGRDKFKVVEVTPEHIILDYLGKSTEK